MTSHTKIIQKKTENFFFIIFYDRVGIFFWLSCILCNFSWLGDPKKPRDSFSGAFKLLISLINLSIAVHIVDDKRKTFFWNRSPRRSLTLSYDSQFFVLFFFIDDSLENFVYKYPSTFKHSHHSSSSCRWFYQFINSSVQLKWLIN